MCWLVPLILFAIFTRTDLWGFLFTTNFLIGSSRGRGNRAAGWFADYIKDQSDSIMQSYTLEEGIKGWAAAGEEYVDMIDGYDATLWK
jgi:hypothetical protein